MERKPVRAGWRERRPQRGRRGLFLITVLDGQISQTVRLTHTRTEAAEKTALDQRVRARASPVPGSLHLEQLRVTSSASQQLVMRAELCDAAAGNDGNPIRDSHRREAMRDHDPDATAKIFLQL